MNATRSNILLQKDDVGMAKPSCRDLPLFGHSYGLPGARDQEGVARCKFNLNWPTIAYYSNYQMVFPYTEQETKIREELQVNK